ncbi:hypothetical protein NARC_160011 [Candidatus Nitrosocosmicus arcticus]|uniref:Uncharacterized protein n=1 Tax=Candidatus Nitrosocosmicus arcticus TaxID=2035267 RepID=A0A557SRS3_9ARCH|nr:hypothetical protein NARC_160011 [Candidatus Nitrosocosmicus arcticus]
MNKSALNIFDKKWPFYTSFNRLMWISKSFQPNPYTIGNLIPPDLIPSLDFSNNLV